jgi:hypothetical protein
MPSAATDLDANLFVRFRMGSRLSGVRTKEAGGVPKYDSVPYITVFIPGDRTVVADREVWDEPTNPMSDTQRWPKQWAAFQAGNTEDVHTGTPLKVWPMVERNTVDELAHFAVHTVEQLAGLSDANCQKFMGSLELREKARSWLQQAERAAPFMELKAELSALRDEKETQAMAMQQRIAQLEALVTKAHASPTETEPLETSGLEQVAGYRKAGAKRSA